MPLLLAHVCWPPWGSLLWSGYGTRCEKVGVLSGKLYCGRKRREGQPGSSEKRLLPPLTPQLALAMPGPGRSVWGLPREEQVGQPGREVAAKVPHTPSPDASLPTPR